jgi:F-type H+-transporting ATPase subunit b
MKMLRNFALVVVLCVAVFALAQDQSAQQGQSSQQKQSSQAKQVPRGVEHPLVGEQQPAPIGKPEEEGHDDHSEFKESPSVKWIAQHTGMSVTNAYWLLIIVNFAIMAALIVWGWKKNVPAMFKARSEAIRKQLEEARKASEDANRRLGEIEQRLSRLDAEISDIRKHAEEEVIAEEHRIKAAAEEERVKVIESAEQEIDAAAKVARRDLKAFAASLAVNLAEKKINVDANTDQALVGRFVSELGHNGGKGGR